MGTPITYLVHSTTPDNEKNISSGWNDTPLSELGIRQSHELFLAIWEKHFDVIFCSDLQRAKQTTEIVFPNHPHIIYDSRLRECNYGDFNWFPSDIVEPLQEKNIKTPFPNGESYEDVKIRIENLLNDIQAKYSGKSVACIGSKAPQIALDVLIRWMTWEGAFAYDWRKTKSWQPWWEYIYEVS